jgi:very-short-patch-repair endonuclease
MTPQISERRRAAAVWALTRKQHGVVSTRQLIEAGFGREAIKHRVRVGRLHRKARGVYAVGRPDISRHGEMMAAVLASGPQAAISHETGCELYAVRRREAGPLEVSVPTPSPRRHLGIRVHNRRILRPHTTTAHGIPVTTLPLTLIDMALRLPERHLEAAVNQADALDLLDPEAMRGALNDFAGQPGVRPLRRLLDGHTFRLTDSELERTFLRLVRSVGLPDPETQRYASSWRVDFLWPSLGLMVETDSLRYHRTPARQARDYRRDHAHHLAGLLPLRFTHYQLRYEAGLVLRLLRRTVERLAPET